MKLKKETVQFRSFIKNIIAMMMIVIFSMLIILFNVGVNLRDDGATAFPTASGQNTVKDREFEREIGAIDLNVGITLELQKNMQDDIRSISFNVYNHTTEPIIFLDQGFGMKLYSYDPINKKWELISLPSFPAREIFELPPNTTKGDFKLRNFWTIVPDELKDFNGENLRLAVFGVGVDSEQEYGAYIDVSLQPPK